MTDYFFDLLNAGTFYADAEGLSLPSDQHAIAEGRRIMGDLVRDGLASDVDISSRSEVSIAIRTVESREFVTLRMILSIEMSPVPAAHQPRP